MRVIVAGAGIGGLAAARLLAAGGVQVKVFERAPSVEDMRYPWHDDVAPLAFEQNALPVPAGSFPKKDWTFIAPNGGARGMHEKDTDISVMRPALNRVLTEEAQKAGAQIVFSAQVQAPLTENGRVVGVLADGKEERADLVVDSLGARSALKAALPPSVAVTRHKEDEVFCVYRAFYARKEDAPAAEYSNKVYLKHLGKPGISWVIQDGAEVDVLVGRVGELSRDDLQTALTILQEENPTISDKITCGGGKYLIPVRYPATRMVADGLALIGDSAYMTIPMLGSGIASSLAAAQMLSDCVLSALRAGKDANFASSRLNLWHYQTAFFRRYADHCGVDAIKRGVLALPDKTLSFILTSKVLSNAQICDLAKGKLLRPTCKDLARMAFAAGVKLPSLLPVALLLAKARSASAHARRIPAEFSEKKVEKWEKNLAKRYN